VVVALSIFLLPAAQVKVSHVIAVQHPETTVVVAGVSVSTWVCTGHWLTRLPRLSTAAIHFSHVSKQQFA
jgi:hypothetical protein